MLWDFSSQPWLSSPSSIRTRSDFPSSSLSPHLPRSNLLSPLVCPGRYGLPVNFQAVLLQPHKKSSTKRLREVLNSVFRHLDEVAAASMLDVGIRPGNGARLPPLCGVQPPHMVLARLS